MSRIAKCFQALRENQRKALIPYIAAGDPDPTATVPLMQRMVEAGADVIELGMPFSDPMADGPIIQKASERALASGITLAKVLALVSEFRQHDTATPVVLMGYFNPIEAMGVERFAGAAAESGVDGVLTVDLPLEEADELAPALVNAGIDPIFLIAPTSDAERIRRTAEVARGYVYYVSLKGVTGSAALDVSAVAEKMTAIRQSVKIPIGVGFGIKDAATAAAVAEVADAVVVGSALVAKMAALIDERERMYKDVAAMIAEMRQAMDAAQPNSTG